MYIYVCVYCVYMYVYVCMHVSMYVYVCMCVYMYTMCVCMCVYMYVYICLCINKYSKVSIIDSKKILENLKSTNSRVNLNRERKK